MSDRMILAQDGWGDVPEWIEVLVKACDRPGQSQSKVAKALGVSAATVSQLIRNSYKADDLTPMQQRVNRVFANGKITCPAQGIIDGATCQNWQDKAGEFVVSNPMRVRMYRACHRCSNYTGGSNE